MRRHNRHNIDEVKKWIEMIDFEELFEYIKNNYSWVKKIDYTIKEYDDNEPYIYFSIKEDSRNPYNIVISSNISYDEDSDEYKLSGQIRLVDYGNFAHRTDAEYMYKNKVWKIQRR